MNLNPKTVLKRAIDFKIVIESVQSIEIIKNKDREKFSNYALTILDIFTHPISIENALKKLEVIGMQDWIQLTSTIKRLWNFGVLHDQSKVQIVSDKSKASFGSAPIHISMLNDRNRTELFISALKETVKEGDVVVDIGTGSGVLAIAAARAGAKKVYAIEAGAMADVAQAVINNTEVANKIQVIRGWSTKVTLPERANVLVSEIIGNDPFGEKVLQTFKDAHERLLTKDVKVLPASIRVFGLPCTIPSSLIKNRVLEPADISNWRAWYGIDFTPIADLGYDKEGPFVMASPRALKAFSFAEKALLLATVDFKNFTEPTIVNKVLASAEGPFNGLLVYFELVLGGSVLSTHPNIADTTNSWKTPVWYFPEAMNLMSNAAYTVHYAYNGAKDSVIEMEI